MTGFLLSLVLFLQTNPTGTVTGVVRNAAGMPAAGVRVYAMAAPKDGGNVAPALEGLSQTDEAGRFRLEVPAGRYFIAAGSVESPTFAPGTPDLTNARLVSITSAAVVDNVDISGYVPPRQGLPGVFNPNQIGSAFVSGVIQYADGSPAAGMYVGAMSASFFNNTRLLGALQSGPQIFSPSARTTRTDGNGRYRLENLVADTFYIMAGFADSQTLYPGVPDIASASTITLTASSKLDNLNFSIPLPPKGTTVRGRIFGGGGTPVTGATVQLRQNSPRPGSANLPPRPFPQSDSRADGSFEIQGVAPGAYLAVALTSDASPISKNIDVTEDKPVDLEFLFAVTVVSGRILSEDGMPFADPQAVGEVALVSGNNPNAILTTLFPLDAAGRFSRTMEEGEYRFILRALPVDYSIHSITVAGTEIVKDSLKVTKAAPVNIEVRLAKRTNSTGIRVRGRVFDAVTGKPAATQRVFLCCQDSGSVYRLSTQVQKDGSFEFTGVTRGRYTAQLQGNPTLGLLDDAIAVGDADVSGVTLLAAAELVQLVSRFASDDGNLAAAAGVTITLTGTSELVKVVAVANATGQAMAWVPAGDSYRVTVSNIPDGYILKAIGGSDGMLMTGGRLTVAKGAVPNVIVMIGKK